MDIPQPMKNAEITLRDRFGPEFNLLGYLLEQVNNQGKNLNEIAAELGISRDNLERWARDCGWSYRTERRFVVVQAVQPTVVGLVEA